MSMSNQLPLEALLANLIHDLRQPLSNLESTTYCLASLTESCGVRVTDQVRVMERQVEQAEMLLTQAAAEMSRLRAQRQAEAVSIDFTNATRAGVT
jgi:signal transduction histidine kinase